MPEVTLGGERLGSGNKMKVDMKTYDRSTHNLSEIFRSTMSAGTLVPCYKKVCLPGDRWEIELQKEMLTHPTEGPLFGSYKAQTDAFIIPIRLYQAKLHMNMINIGRNMSAIKLPQIRLSAQLVSQTAEDIDNAQINPSCVLAYTGIRGVGMRNDQAAGTVTRDFNALPILGYWDIAKQYYSNKQEEVGAVIHATVQGINNTITGVEANGATLPQNTATTPLVITVGQLIEVTYSGARPANADIIIRLGGGPGEQDITLEDAVQGVSDSGTVLSGLWNTDYGDSRELLYWRYRTATDLNQIIPQVVTFPLSNIDEMRQIILEQSRSTTAFVINEPESDQGALTPYNYLNGFQNTYPNKMNSQEGLAVKTYQSDVNNNWLNTEWIDGAGGISEVTAVDTTGDTFTMDQLNLAKKVYDMLNRIAVSGGTYKDWIDVTYTESGAWRADNPIYIGSLIKELVFQEVVSNSASADQPLGTIAGKGVMSQHKHKGGYLNFSVDEPSYLMIITSLTPRVDYSQGNDWDMTELKTMDDFHKPALDQIGFQELITERLAWWDTKWNDTTNEWETKSAGKQPAWINYMTSVNKTYGNFAIKTNEMFMTLNRRYEPIEDGDDVTIKDLTTYIDPAKYNSIFAVETIDAQNFWCQIKIDATVRRVMSHKLMPIV